jgi:PST family polysaccharide transporter
VVVVFFATFWNQEIFGNNYQYKSVFKALALALPWYVVSIFNSVLNGLGSFKRVIWTNSIGNAIGLLVSIVLILSIEPSSIISDCCFSSLLFFFSSIL